jgi:hypothetical protein
LSNLAVGSGASHSGSTQRALDWAQAVARIRERTPPTGSPPPIDALDLFVGALLAHPDVNGEVRVLLDHFGMTARDVVGERYARVTPTTLDAVLPLVSPGAQSSDGPGLADVFATARRLAGGTPRLRHVVGGLLSAQTTLTTRLDTALADIGESRATVASSYEDWLREQPEVQGVTGIALGAWLRQHNLRTPVSVAGFSTDDVVGAATTQPDLVGISAEANALAYLVASVDLVPPLAVGLFGDWGSGKSFLMRDVRARVGRLLELCADQPQHRAAVWQNVQHIEFNAWEYVQGDLWAALLEKVFRAIGKKVLPSMVSARQQPVLDELNEQQEAVKQAEDEATRLQTDRDAVAKEVAEAQQRLTDEQTRKKEDADARAQAQAREAAQHALAGQWDEALVSSLGSKDVEELAQALQEAQAELRLGRALTGPYWRSWKQVVAVTAAVMVVPVVAWVLQKLTAIPDVATVLAALTAAIPTLAGWLRSVVRWSERQRQVIAEAIKEVEDARRALVDQAQDDLLKAQTRLAQSETALAKQQTVVAEAQQHVEELRTQLAKITPGRVFVDFADERSQDYRSKLGLLGTVRDDLRTIESAILDNNVVARSEPTEGKTHDADIPNRIVLYIDDLDRCPPTKVVQVLEAVHLLLAFKMFVVFVAVDSRWVSSALIEELHALRTVNRSPYTRRTDQPTTRDYLEKIFQLPFWVQPLSGNERGQVVSGLLAAAVRSDAPAQASQTLGLTIGPKEKDAVERMLGQAGSGLILETSELSITPTELELMSSLGPLLGNTPRRVKRFVNTVQFLLSLRPPLSDAGPRPPRQAAALYAAIHQGLPSIAREVFQPANAAKPLEDALGAPGVLAAERAVLQDWLDLSGHEIWRRVTPAEIADRSEMVPRLGFDRP